MVSGAPEYEGCRGCYGYCPCNCHPIAAPGALPESPASRRLGAPRPLLLGFAVCRERSLLEAAVFTPSESPARRAESLGAARCPRPSRESVSRTGHIEKQRVHDPLRSRGLSRFSVLVRKRARLGPAQCGGAALLGTATLSPSCLSPQRPPGVAGGAPSHLLMCPAGVGAE